MPQRFCICPGCNGCGTERCGRLFDRDTTGTQRCPRCQPSATAARQARTNTTRRGYGSQHQRLRQQYVDAFMAGQPCVRCGKPIAHVDDADLGHADGQRGYRGLEHSWCNRGASRRKR